MSGGCAAGDRHGVEKRIEVVDAGQDRGFIGQYRPVEDCGSWVNMGEVR